MNYGLVTPLHRNIFSQSPPTSATEEVRIYGFMKLSANVSRAGLPHGYLDRGYVYLGSIGAFADGVPSEGTNEHHLKISEETLEDAETGVAATGMEPILVFASEFNQAELAKNSPFVPPNGVTTWSLSGGTVTDASSGETLVTDVQEDDPGPLNLLLVGFMMLILLVPGFIWFRAIVPDGSTAEALGLVPALAVALLILSGFAVLTISRAPFSSAYAWASVAVATLGALGLWWKRTLRGA